MNILSNSSLTTLFWTNKARINKKGQLPIYVRITVDGKRAEMALQRTIDPLEWNQEAQRATGKDHYCQSINAMIDLTKAKIQTVFNQFTSAGEEITAELIKARITGKEDKPKQKTLLQAFDYHNLKMKEKVERGLVVPKTLLRYEITKNKVQKFMQTEYRKEDAPLCELRLSFVTEFEHYLLTRDKLQSNTAYKYIKNLKKIMTMAVSLDWIPSSPFNNFKCSYTNPKREVLTLQELETLQNKELSIARLAEVRDVFIFCCYTGFAYSDVYELTSEDLVIGIDGEYWITIDRKKTGTRESVPLLPVALEIVKRYKKHTYCVEYGKLLPVNSNQRYNSYLKELANICGIKKTLTTHIARHTFATTITLSNGVPLETVSKMLGHTKLATTQIYAKVLDTKISHDMQQLKHILGSNGDKTSNKRKVV